MPCVRIADSLEEDSAQLPFRSELCCRLSSVGGSKMAVPKCVPDYDALRKLSPPKPAGPKLPPCEQIFVSGYPDPANSGVQGFFSWRPHSAEAENSGTVIKPDKFKVKDKGRWHRVYDGALSVKWFGATGKGTGDDIDAIQACVTAAVSTNVPSVQFPPGRYRITRAIVIQADN